MTEHILKVLLIDDDEDDYFLIRDLFSEIKDIKYQVEWAGDLSKATRCISNDSYDVCLLDYRLGEKTGIDLLEEAVKKGCHFPFILLTGYGDREIDLKAMKSGASDYLVKANLTTQLLERSIRYAIYRKKTEAQIIMQDRMAAVGLLASGLAHEIGTPLGVIKGRAELLRVQSQESETRKTADIVVTQIDRITKLVKSLLNLARGANIENIGAVEINTPINDVLDLMQNEFQKNKIKVINKIPPQMRVAIVGEAEPLHQVILNILINSVHAIELAMNSQSPRDHYIKISTESEGNNWMVYFSDSGCGIAQVNLKNIFKPFFTTKDIGMGTGLGLATSYNIIRSWGGELSVESDGTKGTTFCIKLPKAPAIL